MSEKKSEIKFTVQLDENRMPEKISWHATEAGFAGEKSCKGLMISIFDEHEKNTLKIDLWTKEMMVEEMDRFFAETLMSMADTYSKATSNKEMTDSISEFARDFAKKTGVTK